MTYKEYIPHPILAPYVKCIWTLEANGTTGIDHREKVLPDGCMELIFHYGDLFRKYGAFKNELQPRSFVHGQIKTYIEIGPTGNTGMIAVRFYPHGLAAFASMPMNELTENVTDADALFGNGALEMLEMLGNAKNGQDRVALISMFLTKRLKPASVRTNIVASTVNNIVAKGGNVVINDLAKVACMSERQLERVFMSSVGLSAKTFSRISRFQHSIREAQSGKIITLTQLAHVSGYYDQAHFTKDFKTFTGESPAQYFSEVHALANLFTKA